MQSTVQICLVVLYEDYSFNYEIIYIPSLIILYCTILFVITVFTYIRCCHPFWILNSRTGKSQFIFLVVFILIFVAPMTMKLVLATMSKSSYFTSLKALHFVSDLLLTQTGTGNFFAWYYTQRHRLLNEDDDKLFNMEDSVELGSDIEYVIDIQALDLKKKKNGHKKKKSTLISIFTTPTTKTTNGSSQGGSSIPYKPPSIDVMASEPVLKTSDISYTDENFLNETSNGQIFIESSNNIFIDTDMENNNPDIDPNQTNGSH